MKRTVVFVALLLAVLSLNGQIIIDHNYTRLATYMPLIVRDVLVKVPLEGNYQGYRLSLIDINGRLIKELFVDGNLCEFNVSFLPSGVYVVVLSRSGITNVTKILIP